MKLDELEIRAEVRAVLPALGDVVSFEVRPGIALLFRVVAKVDDARCVVLTTWEGKRAPKKVPAAKSVFEVRALKHHAWDRPMIGGWVKEATPDALVLLGNVKVAKRESSRVLHPREFVMAKTKSAAMGKKVLPMSSWASLIRDALAQWRWDHERESVLEEEAAVERAKTEALHAELTRRTMGVVVEEALLSELRVSAAVREVFEAAAQRAVQAMKTKDAVSTLQQLMREWSKAGAAKFDELARAELDLAAFKLAEANGVSEATYEREIASLLK